MKTTITFYKFNLAKNGELEEYNEIKAKLAANGVEKVYSFNAKYIEVGIDDHGTREEEVKLDATHIFDNQWNGDCQTLPDYRIFDWSENYIENYKTNKFRSGYFLEITPEILDLRTNTFKCGYCGKTTKDFGDGFCHQCLGGDYMDEETICGLTALRNFVKKPHKRGKFGENGADIEEYLKELRVKQQERFENLTKLAIHKVTEEISEEANLRILLLEELKKLKGAKILFGWTHFYKNTITFSRGLHGRKFTKEEGEELKQKIIDVGFNFPFKVETESGSI